MVHISDDVVNDVRHVVQKILVPCIFVIGLLGNSVSIYVLTRKRMRCTTNIYLTALAITDIFFLTMAVLNSLEHYDYIHRHVKVYWQLYGTLRWLVDACSYISIYISVCFTIERFIAIRYPLKRQTFCTESLAKKVIVGVSIFCILSTVSTLFEHAARVEYRLLDEHGKPCTSGLDFRGPAPSMSTLQPGKTVGNSFDSQSTVEGSGIDTITGNPDSSGTNSEQALHRMKRILQLQPMEASTPPASLVHIPLSPDTNHTAESPLAEGPSKDDNRTAETITIPHIFWENEYKPEMIALELKVLENKQFCQNVTYYSNTVGILGDNNTYNAIWSYVSLIVYVLVPLSVLATFNCFLVVMVRRSHTLRGQMTNASSMRKPKEKTGSTSVSQENRVTITLIAVVVCFMIFQLPWAAYTLTMTFTELDPNFTKVSGNVCNFLTDLSAAANFFLYCVLSDKYRKTIRELITGKTKKRERGTLTSTSLYTNNTSRGNYRPAPTTAPDIK